MQIYTIKDIPNLVTLKLNWGSDRSIAETARISTGSTKQDFDKTIRFLVDHEHTSPFEQAGAQFEIKAPIYVIRQWMRSRTQSYLERSGRYTILDDAAFIPAERLLKNEEHDLVKSCEASFKVYHELLQQKVKREIARIALPLATMTEFFVSANLWNWIHFLKLRLFLPGAQQEIRDYAQQIAMKLAIYFPLSINDWTQHYAAGKPTNQ